MAKGNLSNLLTQLSVQSTHEEHANVEATCLQLLSNSCDKPADVLRQYLVAMIKQDKYTTALKVLNEYKHIDGKFGKVFAKEKLYIFYKLNMVEKFESLAKTIIPEKFEKKVTSFSDRTLLHIKAQFCYKNGKYDDAFAIYQILSSHNENSLDNPLELGCNERVNLSAKPSLLISTSPFLNILDHMDYYDLLFNEALIKCSQKDYTAALDLLEKALDLAYHEDIVDDINTIKFQISYVNQMLGRKEESKKQLTELLDVLTPGSPLYILVKTNMNAFVDFSKFSSNLNVVLKEINSTQINSLNLQNFTFDQWAALQSNNFILNLFNNSSVQSKSSLLSRTLARYSSLIGNASLDTYKSQAKKILKFTLTSIKSGITQNPSIIGMILLTVQLAAMNRQWDCAVNVCESFLNKLWSLDTVVKASMNTKDEQLIILILFQLYNAASRSNSKTILLKKIAANLNSSDINQENILFWQHIAFEYMSVGDSNTSKAILEKLLKARDVIANDKSQIDLSFAETVLLNSSSNYEIGNSLVENIAVSTILSGGVDRLSPGKKKNDRLNNKRISKQSEDLKKKKLKEKRLQKYLETHDLTKKPDPERWLPLKDRSTFRLKKKQMAKQTQGGAMNKKAEQALDISAKTATKKISTSSTAKKAKKGKKGKKGRK